MIYTFVVAYETPTVAYVEAYKGGLDATRGYLPRATIQAFEKACGSPREVNAELTALGHTYGAEVWRYRGYGHDL